MFSLMFPAVLTSYTVTPNNPIRLLLEGYNVRKVGVNILCMSSYSSDVALITNLFFNRVL